MKKIAIISFLIILLTGCKDDTLDDRDSFVCYIKDFYTGEPLKNVQMEFYSKSYIYDEEVKDKLIKQSDENGRFVFEDLGYYKSSELSMTFIHSEDSTELERQYVDNDYLNFNSKHTLKVKPSGVTVFEHPANNNYKYPIDTVIVKSYNQIDTLIYRYYSIVSQQFYLLPNISNEIEITYIKGGNATTKTITEYIPNYYTNDRKEHRVSIPE